MSESAPSIMAGPHYLTKVKRGKNVCVGCKAEIIVRSVQNKLIQMPAHRL